MSHIADKLTLLRRKMTEQGVDLLALGPGAHMHWVTGWHPHPDERLTLVLVSAQDACVVGPAVNGEQIDANIDLPLHRWKDEDGPEAVLARTVGTMGKIASVALDETMRTDFSLTLLAILPGAAHTLAHDIVGQLRMTKDDAEFAALKASQQINDRAMQAGFAAIKPGVTERHVAGAIRDAFAAEGAEVAFALCASGPNGAFPHHSTGDRQLQAGDAVVLDIGAGFAGWPSDMTRMAAVGHLPDGYAEIHAVVEAASAAAMNAARPGVKAHEVDDAARKVITDAGYGEYFVHRTGHGLGLEIHEPPYLTSSSQAVLTEGMVFSIEPGIYIPGRFGIRLEEIVILRKDGPEIFSDLPRDVHIAR